MFSGHDSCEALEALEDVELMSSRSFLRRTRIYRERSKDFHKYDEKDFFLRYRLSKESILYSILQKIEHLLEFHDDRYVPPFLVNWVKCILPL